MTPGIRSPARRRFLALSGASAAASLCGCYAGPCARPALPAGIDWPGAVTYGEVRRCTQETSMSLHGVEVVLPEDAPSISSDYRTALDVNFDVRPFRHTGIDIAGIEGRTPAIAALDGIVDKAANYYSGGNCVTLYHGTDEHGRDLVSGYFHLSQLLVDDGTLVPRGGIVGTVGMTGTTSGSVPHLHFNLFYGRALRGSPFGHYFYDAHVNPHLYWYDGPGKVTLFDPARTYTVPYRLTYPVAGRSLVARAEALAATLAATRAARPVR